MKYLIILAAIFLSLDSQAVSTCSKNGTRILYTNGIQTEPQEAQDAMLELAKIIKSENDKLGLNFKRIDRVSLKYEVAYNYEESIAKDILESAVQKLPPSYIASVQAKSGYEALAYFLQGKNIHLLSSTIINSINFSKIAIISTYANTFINTEKYLQTKAEMQIIYNRAINKGERIFAISHSQGSLFMNETYEKLPENYQRKYFSGY